MNKLKNSDESRPDNVAGLASFWKAIATIVIWVFVTGGLALTGVFFAPVMGEDAIGVVFLLLAAAVVSTGFIWNWGQHPDRERRRDRRRKARRQRKQESDEDYYDMFYGEKRKGGDDRLANALRQLTDDELVTLRERISRGEIDEDDLEAVLLDDDY